jgi:transposase
LHLLFESTKHKNGKTYIQIIEKVNGKTIVKKSFGSASNEFELEDIVLKAQYWIKKYQGSQEIDFDNELKLYNELLQSITSHKLVGVELVLGKIFNEIGFNLIKDELFKHLVLFRLVYPKSKLKTVEYLYRFTGVFYSEDDIYRYMDKLHRSQKEQVQEISFNHTQKILSDTLQVVFYDVTTIYFEIDNEDDIRKTGFSKEGKHQHPQIVLGLLVSKGGYPLAYDIFEGNKFEGHTMLPIVDAFKTKYQLQKLVIVADSGLLSNDNIIALQNKEYEFILGARIKSENKAIKDKILALSLRNGESVIINRGDLKLIITYSEDRAKKDKYNREKGLKRLEKQLSLGKLTKSNINNKGYNKFLEMDGEITLKLNKAKILEDQKWDGLKGYLTNSSLDKNEILDNYSQLWQIEKAFRVAKTDLKIRPIYHYKQRRIEAHICLNFVAYKIYKELERQLKIKKSNLSPEKVIEIIQSIYQIEITTPKSKEVIAKTLLLSDEHRIIADLFNFGC